MFQCFFYTQIFMKNHSWALIIINNTSAGVLLFWATLRHLEIRAFPLILSFVCWFLVFPGTRFAIIRSVCLTFSIRRTGSSGRTVVHDIETVVIEWTHQIRDVLKKDSAQPLLEGLNPTPYVEIEFWNAKAQNLRCIFDQVFCCRVCSFFLP